MHYEFIWVEIAISIHTLITQSIDIEIDQRKLYYGKSCCLNMADDWILSYQIMHKIWNSAKCGNDFGTIYFACNMSMKKIRKPYRYQIPRHGQWITEPISENYVIVHLVVWIRKAMELDSFESCKTIEKSADLPYMEHISRTAANHLKPTPYGIQYNCSKFKLSYVSNSIYLSNSWRTPIF